LLCSVLFAISFVPDLLFAWGLYQLRLSGLLGFVCSAHCPVVLVDQVFAVHGLESGFLFASDLFASLLFLVFCVLFWQMMSFCVCTRV